MPTVWTNLPAVGVTVSIPDALVALLAAYTGQLTPGQRLTAAEGYYVAMTGRDVYADAPPMAAPGLYRLRPVGGGQ